MIVEYEADAPGVEPPPRAREIAAVAQPGLSLHHCRIDVDAFHPTVWFMGIAAHADRDAVRRLRLHLTRIHAEHQCLKLVVASVLRGDLAEVPKRPGLKALDVYLDKAGTLRLSSTRNGLPQDEILDVAYRTDAIVTEGELPTLLERLDAARASVKRKLERIAI